MIVCCCADVDSDGVIVLDDDDDAGAAAGNKKTPSQSSYVSSIHSPLKMTLRTAPLPSNVSPASIIPASAAISPSIIPQMIFTLQNGNAVMMQPRPALVAAAGYTPSMQLVNPVTLAANTVPMPLSAQVSLLNVSALPAREYYRFDIVFTKICQP